MSHCSASVRPNPIAWPFTAAITGLDSVQAGTSMPAALNAGPGSVKVPLARAEIGARAERGRRAGQHDDADVVAAVAPQVGVGQLLAHAVADGVALPRPVQRDGCHTAVDGQSAVCGKRAGRRGWPRITSGCGSVIGRDAPAPGIPVSSPCPCFHPCYGGCNLDPSLASPKAAVPQEIWPGKAYPLGATYDGSGTNFAVFSEVAERVELCLFDADGTETRSTLPEVDGFVWHGFIPEHRAGPALRLPRARALRSRRRPALQPEQAAAGSRTPRRSTASFDWNQSLFGYNFGDPDSRNDDDSAASMPKSVVINPYFDWGVDRPPSHEYADTVIYEAHVKGLTQTHPDIPEQHPRHLRRGRASGDHRAPHSRWASPRSS